MKKVYMVLRVLFGVCLVVVGANMVFQFGALPEMSPAAMAFLQALLTAKYMIIIGGIVAMIAGLSFVINKYVALSALLLLPITVNLVAFHLFLDIATGLGAYIFLLLNLYILWVNKETYTMLLRA